jgi:hypothetical protein
MLDGEKITRNDIIEHQRYLKGFLLDKVPEADLTDGSFLNDVVVRSMAYVVALFAKEASNVKSRISLDSISEVEDATAAQVLDDLASNFFLSRKDGTFSSGEVTVLVSTNETAITISPFTRFIKSNGVSFVYAGGLDGETSLTISTSNFIPEVDSDSVETGNYYFKVPVVGEIEFIGSELAPGVFQSSAPSIPNVISIRNTAPFSLAESSESNFEFGNRIKSAITNRGFASVSGIETYLLDTISVLRKVKAIPASSSLMRRDLLEISGVTSGFKTLGKCNLYSNLGIVKYENSLVLPQTQYSSPDPNGLVTIEIPRTGLDYSVKSLLAISRIMFRTRVDRFYDSQNNHIVTLADNTLVESNPENYVAPYHVEFEYLPIVDSTEVNTSGALYARTSKERLAVKVNDTTMDTSLNMVYFEPATPELVESEVNSEENKVLGLTILPYSFNVKLISLKLCYFKQDTDLTTPTPQIIADLASYINKRANQEVNVSLADIYSYALDQYSAFISGIDFSESYCEMSIFLPNGRTVVFEVGTSTSLSSSSTREYYLIDSSSEIKNYDYLPNDYLTALQVGDDSCIVYASIDSIELVEVSI